MVHHAIRNRLFVSYILIGTVLLLGFSSIIMNSAFNSAISETSNDIERIVEQNYITAEDLLKTLSNNITDSTITEPAIIMGLYGDTHESFKMFDIHSTLQDMVDANPIIDSIYVYNHFTGQIFNSYSASRKVYDFYEPGIDRIISRGLSGGANKLIPRITELRYISESSSEKYWITMTLTQTNDRSGSAVLINISQQALQDFIYRKDESAPDFIESFIIRSDGLILSHEDREMFGKDVRQESYIRDILDSPLSRGEFETTINTDRVNVRFIKSNSLESIFITLVYHDEMVRNARSGLNWMGVITIVFILMTGLGALFFTRFIYSPLGRLVQVAEMGLEEDFDGSEYEVVTSFIEYMNLRLSEASRKLNEYLPEEKRVQLRGLLQGRVPGESIPEYWKDEYDIDLSGPSYAILIFWLNTAGRDKDRISYKQLQQEQSEKIEYILQNFSRDFNIEIVAMEPGQLVAILNIEADKERTYPGYLEKLSEDFSRWSGERYGHENRMFTGPLAESIDEIQIAYNRTVDISRYHIIYPDKKLISPVDIETNMTSEYDYPADLEKKILDAVRLGTETELPDLLERFSQRIRVFRYNEVIISLTQLVLIISRAAHESLRDDMLERWSDIISAQRRQDFMTLDEIVSWIEGVCAELINHSRNVAATKHLPLIEKIHSIVESDYGDNTLCAATIADGVGFSTNYLRQVYKKNTGESLSDYITRVRFDKAKEYLENTNLTTKTIAENCGFYNADYFYYAFRKMTGMTPGNFRKRQNSVKI